MKFKFIHKISVIQEKFLVFVNLLQGQYITRSGAGSGPWVVRTSMAERKNKEEEWIIFEEYVYARVNWTLGTLHPQPNIMENR